MSRARILADYVSSGDELADKAPIASPTFTGTVGGLGTPVINLGSATGAIPAGVTGGAGLTGSTSLGTVATGTLGSGVVFDDAHKDIDCDEDSFEYIISGSNEYTSDSEINYGWEARSGSNISRTASGYNFTVQRAGWYFIHCKGGHQALYTQDMHLKLRISDPSGAAGNTSYVTQTGRMYTGSTNTGTSYWGLSMMWIVYLRSTDNFGIYGSGYLYGNTTSTATQENAQNKLMGFRIGA